MILVPSSSIVTRRCFFVVALQPVLPQMLVKCTDGVYFVLFGYIWHERNGLLNKSLRIYIFSVVKTGHLRLLNVAVHPDRSVLRPKKKIDDTVHRSNRYRQVDKQPSNTRNTTLHFFALQNIGIFFFCHHHSFFIRRRPRKTRGRNTLPQR